MGSSVLNIGIEVVQMLSQKTTDRRRCDGTDDSPAYEQATIGTVTAIEKSQEARSVGRAVRQR